MKSPSSSSSSLRLLFDLGAYHFAQLTSDPRVESIASRFAAAQTMLRDIVTSTWAAREGRAVAKAQRDRKRAALHEAVREFDSAVLRSMGRDRTSSHYVRYFPDGLNGVVRGPLTGMLDKVSVLLTHLESEEDASLRDRAEPLLRAYTEAAAGSAEYAAATLRFRQARGIEHGGKLNWIDAYKGSYYMLSDRLSRRAAESYFVRVKPRRRRTGGADTPDGNAGEGGAEALVGAGVPSTAGSSTGTTPEPARPGTEPPPNGNGSGSGQQAETVSAESKA